METNQNKALDKILNLLNLAEHENTGAEEAESARQMANKLMTKFAIEEHQLAAAGKSQKTYVPVVDKFQFCDKEEGLQEKSLLQEYYSLIHYIAIHNRCRVHGEWNGSATLVGYESDIWMTKIMFSQVRLHMAGKVDPKVDLALSFDENVYNLHEAGLIWKEIARRMDSASAEGGWKRFDNGSLGRLIGAAKRQAKAEGVDYSAKSNPHLYRKSFAESYTSEISQRLYRMKKASEEDTGEEGALVLVSRKDNVDDMFKEMFPPPPPSKYNRARKYREHKRDASASAAGRSAAASADLSGGAGGMGSASRKELV